MLFEKLAEFDKRRLQFGPLPSGAAQQTSSHSFKGGNYSFLPKAKRWDHRLSIEAQARHDSTLKASSRAAGPSIPIPLGTARPASEYYPWDSIDILGMNKQVQPSEPTPWMSCTKGEAAFDLALALNYGHAAGSPQLVRFITEHTELMHDPPYSDWETSLTCGTTSALEMVFRMLCNRGDSILTEEYTYSGAVEAAKALGLNVLNVKMDSFGLVPEDLDSKMRNWNSANQRRPFVLYTIPTGQNPTGVTQPMERRRAIYQIAERHDLIIIEDDPYYFLELNGACNSAGQTAESPDTYVKKLLPSYLSLDATGRVVRLDTASKILAPGLRIGWITACSQLIAKFLNHTEFSTSSPSGPSQVMMYKLLDESWGHAGFVNWLMQLSGQYNRRLRILADACTAHLPIHLCCWTSPTFGMFVWVQIDWRKHPSAREDRPIEEMIASRLDIEDRIYLRARQTGVQISKGSWFATGPESRVSMYFRLTFAAAPGESLDPAIERFGRALRTEFLLGRTVEREHGSCSTVGQQIAVGA